MNVVGLWCAKSGFLEAIRILKAIIRILCIVGPAIIVVTSMISFFKSTIDDSKTKESVIKLIEKIFIGSFLMFIPTIVTAVISMIGNGSHKKNFLDCWNNADATTIQYIKDVEKAESDAKQTKKASDAAEAIKKSKESREKEKSNHQAELQEKESGDIGVVINSNPNTIYIGDSRTVGIYYTINPIGYSSEVNTSDNGEYWLAKVAMGYNWFTNTAVPYIKEVLSHGDCTVTIQMGTNDLYSARLAASYVQQVKNLAATYPKSDFVIISVNPIDDEKAKKYGYTVTNSQAIEFNKAYREEISSTNYKNISYCDVYSKIINDFNASDGIHFDNNTNKKIYSYINECI